MADFASCCVLSYERPDFLRTAIETLHKNANAPFELIVHDDGSANPEVSALLDGLLGRGLVSTVILNPPGHNQGRGTAMNRSLAVASGDPLVVIDQDLVFNAGWLRRVTDLLASAPTEGRIVPLYNGARIVAHALVDDEDYEFVTAFRWGLNTGYAALGVGGRGMLGMHQLLACSAANPSITLMRQWDESARQYGARVKRWAWGVVESTALVNGLEVDHRNRRRLDNRRANLRLVTPSANRGNVRANATSSSPYRGVSWSSRHERWVAQGQTDGRTKHLGLFDSETEAAWECERFRREQRPEQAPDPVLVTSVDTPPPIGVLAGLRYWHDPCDWRKTIRTQYSGWQEHDYVMGSFMAIPRAVWEVLGPFEEHSPAFAEDHVFQRKVSRSDLWVCATPDEDLMENVGWGVGPSTVVTGFDSHGKEIVQSIHTEPVIFGR